MQIYFDAKRLSRLLSDLHSLSGVHVRVLGSEGGVLCESGDDAPFCARMNGCLEGRARCQNCGPQIIRERGAEGVLPRRCHAGVRGLILPIRSGEQSQPLAYLSAGQFLDAAAPGEQWRAARAELDWFPGDADALREPFLRLPSLSRAEQSALAGMLETLADYIRLRGLIQPAGESDLQRLSRFLDEHYAEKLSLASISAQLHIGRTRLCALAKELSGGETLCAMIGRRRIEAAQALLIRTDNPISSVAEAVGVSDYNYFSKLFRAATGTSPSEFRKRARRDLDDLV